MSAGVGVSAVSGVAYEQPNETSHEELADVLDCAPSTVGEHLRKAEKRLVSDVFD